MADDKSMLVRIMGDHPSIRILDFLIDNKNFDYSKTDACEGANVSPGSLYKIWHNLEESEIVVKTRQYGATKLYRLNKENPLVKKLLELDLELCRQYAQFEAASTPA
ncbi:MAG: helix-turn-helix transcriptional regulator [Candidatus Altiarchaeota archaeon]|nr:helix-turn-helix transcriptional regulator [Candidatus Altiarchaeota archaeon]